MQSPVAFYGSQFPLLQCASYQSYQFCNENLLLLVKKYRNLKL